MNLYSASCDMLDCEDDVQLLAWTDAETLTRCIILQVTLSLLVCTLMRMYIAGHDLTCVPFFMRI